MRPLPQLADFPLPENRQMECQLLTELLYYPENLLEITRIVNEDMFFNLECKKIWREMQIMSTNHETISTLTMMPKCNRQFFIENIMSCSPNGTLQGARSLAMSLYDLYVKRLAYITAVDSLNKINEGKNCDVIEGLFRTFGEKVAQGANDVSFKDAVSIANDLAEDLATGRRKYRTNIPTLDDLTYGGFEGGKLIILSARPSVGKTTIAMQWAKEASLRGEDVLVFSMEMTDKELIQRQILATGYVSHYEVLSGNMNWGNYERAVGEVCNPHFLINDRSRTLGEIRQKILLKTAEGKCKYVVIDYLGLIDLPHIKGLTMAQQVGLVTKELKHLSQECDVPIILLCQLNRASASDSRPPQLFDLRDSGNIEQDADIVLMMDNGKDKMGNVVQNAIDMWVRKNRGGKKTFDEPIHLLGNEIYSNFREVEYYEN